MSLLHVLLSGFEFNIKTTKTPSFLRLLSYSLNCNYFHFLCCSRAERRFAGRRCTSRESSTAVASSRSLSRLCALAPHFLLISFPLTLTGFTLFVREESGAWKEMTVSGDQRSYLLQDLLCGTKYQVYISAHNEAGTGLPSNTIATRTHGTGSFLSSSFANRETSSFLDHLS